MLADKVFFQVQAALDGKRKLAEFVEDIAGGDRGKTVVADGAPVVFGIEALALIGGVALHNGAVQPLHQRLDQGRLEKVVAARFAGGELDGDAPRQRNAQRVIDAEQPAGGEILGKVYF